MTFRLQSARLVVTLACLISACGDDGGGGGDPCGDRIVDLTWTKSSSSCERGVLIPQQLIFNEDGSLSAAGGCTANEDGVTSLHASNGVCALRVDLECPDPDSEVEISFVIDELGQEPVELQTSAQVFGVCSEQYEVTVEL